MDIAGQFAHMLEVIPPALGLVASATGIAICFAARWSQR